MNVNLRDINSIFIMIIIIILFMRIFIIHEFFCESQLHIECMMIYAQIR